MSGKRLIGAAMLVLVLLGLWQGVKFFRTTPPPPVPTQPEPEIQAPPLVEEARPAPPLKTAQKPILQAPKKIPAAAALPRAFKPIVPPPPAPPPPPPAFVPPPPPEPKEWHGNDTSVKHSGQVVIRNDRQWIKFWSEHHPHEAAPDVDFAKEMVIGMFVGQRPADQFAVQILNVRTQPDQLIVEYRELIPPPGTLAVGVTVYPYALKVVPRSALPVKFNLLVTPQ